MTNTSVLLNGPGDGGAYSRQVRNARYLPWGHLPATSPESAEGRGQLTDGKPTVCVSVCGAPPEANHTSEDGPPPMHLPPLGVSAPLTIRRESTQIPSTSIQMPSTPLKWFQLHPHTIKPHSHVQGLLRIQGLRGGEGRGIRRLQRPPGLQPAT